MVKNWHPSKESAQLLDKQFGAFKEKIMNHECHENLKDRRYPFQNLSVPDK